MVSTIFVVWYSDYSTNQLSLAESLEKLGTSSLSKEADTGIGE